MTLRALITGKLAKAPEKRSSKNGNEYGLAHVAYDAETRGRATVFVFGEDQIATLMSLKEGDSVSVSGTLKTEVYTPEGKDPRVSLTLSADSIITLLPKPKPYAPKGKRYGSEPVNVVTPATLALSQRAQAPAASSLADQLDDVIPF
jgi:hypothetical protein